MSADDRLQLIAQLTGLGTVTALAAAAQIKPGTAQKHKDRNSIPRQRALDYIKAAEERGVFVSYEWLQAGRGPVPKPPPANFVYRIVPKLPTGDEAILDKDSALRLPLWQIRVSSRGVEASVPVLAESRDKVLAPEALRDFTSAFAVRVWDSSNGPYLRRGTILYVERPYGGSVGDICIFAESHDDVEVIRPVLGVLEDETDTAWTVLQHTTTIELAKAKFPICWRIKRTNRD